MELKLRCTVSHGVGWNGGVRLYSGNIGVDLHEHEIKSIKDVLSRSDKEGAFSAVEDELPDIYEKIERAAFSFKVYSLVLDTCVRWNAEFGDVREEDLMEEDIQSGKFVPLYENAEGSSRDPLIMNQWFVWLVEGLKHLNYQERADYLINRYQIEIEPFEDLEYETSYVLA